jgi:MATE family multidrug resistance protein
MFGHFGLPAMGVAGAGVATSMTHIFTCVGLLAYVVWQRDFRRYGILVRVWKPDWARFATVLRLGLPIGITVIAEVGMFAAAAFLMGVLGTRELAAHAIALQCISVAFMVPLGISQAALVRTGLAVGAGDRSGIGRAGWVALALGAGFAALAAFLFWVMPWSLVGLFLDLDVPDNHAVGEMAVTLLAIAALFQVVDGAQVIGAGALRGLRDTRVPMVIAAVGYWGIGFTASVVFAFPLGMGGVGVWLGMALGLAVVAVLLLHRFHARERFALAMPAVVPAR